ncbi:Squamosa promoter-binding-like protein [Actinidia chinensis var. chinensis]|uniref:Squamosa promoter-binding-like protein n=1 Tax=Actinidia chinensis var. chinensis TaxID=1590841 RepID=A0A2R6QC20_ACTCC|nr:Squamosa promoter-binding-like protein [Actinidia chinensis var. chinensis]
MEVIKEEIVRSIEADIEEQRQPLLEDHPISEETRKTPGQKAIRKTFKMSAHLSNLLPTGSVLAFQILSPVFTHEGKCLSFVSRAMTLALLGICGASCFLLCLTDSFRDEKGKVRYGLATARGLWVIDGGAVTIAPDKASKYRLQPVDFLHAFLSFVVFAAVALFDQNVVKCFCPKPSDEATEILTTLPIGIGLICCLLFVAFPTKRHGIGFPLSRN